MDVTTKTIVLILIVSIFLLIICIYYLRFLKKKKQAYEDELIREIKFENKLKKEETKNSNEIKKKPQVDIAAMLDKMQADLEGKNQDKIIDFEQAQEETSIISYKELKRATQEHIEKEERAQEQSPISVKEVLSLKEEEKEKMEDPILSLLQNNTEEQIKEVTKKEVHPVLQKEEKKFQGTEFISPIYGKQEQKAEYPHIPVYEEHDEVLSVLDNDTNESLGDKQENEDFLNELRDFRNQL